MKYPHEKVRSAPHEFVRAILRMFKPKVERLVVVIQRTYRPMIDGAVLTYIKNDERTYWIVDEAYDTWENGHIATTELSCRPTTVPLPNWFGESYG